MNFRRVIVGLSLLTLCFMLGLLLYQHEQLVDLRGERQSRLVKAAALVEPQAPPANQAVTGSPPVSRELLQLRNKVGQLRRRRDELLPARTERERLLLESASRATNVLILPTNYIRKAQAQLVGYNSPEDTAQSFLYAIRNRDVTNLLQALTPSTAGWLQSQEPNRVTTLLDESQALIGLALRDQRQLQADVITASAEVLPGIPPLPMTFRLVNGQWKLDYLP